MSANSESDFERADQSDIEKATEKTCRAESSLPVRRLAVDRFAVGKGQVVEDASTDALATHQKAAHQGCFIVESLKISGDALMGKVTDLIGQGNVHRIVIKNKEGHTLLSVPTDLNPVDSCISAILSTEATAIKVISAIVPYPKVVVEKISV